MGGVPKVTDLLLGVIDKVRVPASRYEPHHSIREASLTCDACQE
jgi:hypothetical protein